MRQHQHQPYSSGGHDTPRTGASATESPYDYLSSAAPAILSHTAQTPPPSHERIPYVQPSELQPPQDYQQYSEPYPPHPGPSVPHPYFYAAPYGTATRSRTFSAVLAFFLGVLGMHNLYLGYQLIGLIQLMAGIIGWFGTLTGGAAGVYILGSLYIWVFVEFILILSSRDGRFSRTAYGELLV